MTPADDTTAIALEALRRSSAIKAAWSCVNIDELATALRLMPNRGRNQMLSKLRVPTAKITSTTARLVLTSLTRNPGERLRAAKFITRHLAHQVTDAIDEAISEESDPVEAMVAKAQELTIVTGATIVCLAAVANAYTEPDYYVPFLVSCAGAGLLPVGLAHVEESVHDLPQAFLDRLEERHSPDTGSSLSEDAAEDEPLRTSWVLAQAAGRRIQKALRGGRPVEEEDLTAVREFTTRLRSDAERIGLEGEISVQLVQGGVQRNEAVRALVNLQGPDEMITAINEVRELCGEADGEMSRRLTRFMELVLDPSPLGRITRANELRLEPEPPSRGLLDAGIAGVLSLGNGSTAELEMVYEVPAAPAPLLVADTESRIPDVSTAPTEAEPARPPSYSEEATVKEELEPDFSDVTVDAEIGDSTAPEVVREEKASPRPSAKAEELSPVHETESALEVNIVREVEWDLEDVAAALSRLVSTARFDLAHHVATAADHEYRAGILAEAAFAHSVRSPNSPAAAEMVDRAAIPLVPDDQGSVLLRLASTLRVALLDPGSGAPAVLSALSSALDQLPALRDLARVVATPTSQMVAIAAGGEVLDAADAMRAATAIAAWASDSIAQSPHRFRFHRAMELWQNWSAPEGPVGEILAFVASDDAEAVDLVRTLCRPYVTRERIDSFIEEEDRHLREGRTGRPQPMVGQVRRQLGRAFTEVIDQALAWCEARGRAAGTDWSFEQREQLAVQIEGIRPLVLSTLDRLSGDFWMCAARDAARDSIEATMGLFRDEPLRGSEADPESVLDRCLALVIEIPTDESGHPLRQPTLAEILEAQARSFEDAFELRIGAEQFGAAEIILDIAAEMSDAFDDEEARVRLASIERDARARITKDYEALYTRFAGARARGRIDEDTATTLHSRLLGARPNDPEVAVRRDLGALRSELVEVAERLEEAIIIRREKVRADIESAIGDDEVSVEWGARLRALMEREELGAAEEYLYRAQAGEDPPDATREDADALLVSRALAYLEGSNLNDELVEAVRAGESICDLDLSIVPDIARQEVAAALASWVELHSPDRQSRWNNLLQPVLRLLGIVPTALEAPPALRSQAVPGHFMYIDVIGEHSGDAFVPSFGSRAHGRRRMMLAFQSMPAGQLWDTAIRGATSDQPVYVLYVGNLTAEGRLALAREARSRETGQVIVIDDAVVLACVIAGRQAYDVTMRAALPYTAANPYNPDLPGEIPEEMFYGRRFERESIANLTGASFVSGGRRFGKTALLHSVRKRYDLPQSNVLALFVMIQHVAAGPQQAASDLWPLLARRLIERKILGSGVVADAEGVSSGLRHWLQEDTTRHLLLLLDECDLFLRADADGGFRNVAELRDLMIDFGGRFKVVFSGLQHVARYLKLPNQPLSQLPPPIVIGPLDPSAACDLVRRPLEALGFAPTPAQIDRLVTYCACNPSVIQLAGMQLVELLREQPVNLQAPWPMDDNLLDRLLDSAELAAGVRNRLFLTLNLDHRYKLLAYLVAFRALNDGLGTAASPTELRTLAFEYWPDGFSSQHPDDVRALCDELVGLGIFAGDADTGYRMLSPAAVRLFGTGDEIESELSTAFETYVPDMTLGAAGSRPQIEGVRYSPLSASQLADVVGQGRTQLRVVIGSRALCSQDVPAALRVAANAMPNVTVTDVSSLKSWREMMFVPTSGHRVVIPSDSGFSRGSFEESVIAARSRSATRSAQGTRAAVLVVGPHHREMLGRLVAPVDSKRRGDLADVSVSLGRVDLDSLRAWARIEELDVVLPNQLARLLEVTGGWPCLIESLLGATRVKPFDVAAQELADSLSTFEGAHQLLADVGLDVDDPSQPADAGLLEVLRTLALHDLEGDPETLVDLLSEAELVREKDPAEALAILRAIGVVVVDESGNLAVEPLVRQCLLRVTNEVTPNS